MQRWAFFLAFVTNLYLIACSQEPKEYGLNFKQISIDGVVRKYAIYIPKDLKPNLPVIFCLHGGGGHIEAMTGQTVRHSPYKLWTDIAEQDGALIVYPQATEIIPNRPTWNDCRADCQICANADDVGFLSRLIDTVIYKYKANPQAIFFCGVSNGGFMTLRMATCKPEKIRAIAVIIASLPDTSKCTPPFPVKPLPALFINGTEDPLLPYEGGIIGKPPDPKHGSCKPVDSTIKFFVRLNQCDTVPKVFHLADINTSDHSHVVRYYYRSNIGCDVQFYKVIGGGHTAPSILEQYSRLWLNYVGPQNHDMETVYEIWRFFQQYIP